jgi:hypothetical protein
LDEDVAAGEDFLWTGPSGQKMLSMAGSKFLAIKLLNAGMLELRSIS